MKIEKLEYYSSGITSKNGSVTRWTYHPNNDDIVEKINEIIDKLNEWDKSVQHIPKDSNVLDALDALKGGNGMGRYIDANGDISEKIRKLTEKIEEKRLAEINRIGDALQKDQKDAEIILAMIHDNRLFFKKTDPYNEFKYQVITEEEFLKDYTTEPKDRYTRRIRWNESWNDSENCYQSVVSVNGISYFDMRYIMWAYEQDIDNLRRCATALKDRIIEIEDQAKKIREQYPAIVQMMKDWQEWQEQRGVTE